MQNSDLAPKVFAATILSLAAFGLGALIILVFQLLIAPAVC